MSCDCGCEADSDKPVQYKCNCGQEQCSCCVVGFDKEPDAKPFCCGVAMKKVK